MNQSTLELQLSLGKSLALARKAKGQTQGELAEEAGLSRATIANIESGGADPKLSTIAELAKALEISPAWLLMTEQDMEVLGEIATSESVSGFQEALPDELVDKIDVMIESGGKKRLQMALNSIQVALQGSEDEDSLLKASKQAAAQSVFGTTAIGTGLLPGIGTAIGAAWNRVESEFRDDDDGEDKG